MKRALDAIDGSLTIARRFPGNTNPKRLGSFRFHPHFDIEGRAFPRTLFDGVVHGIRPLGTDEFDKTQHGPRRGLFGAQNRCRFPGAFDGQFGDVDYPRAKSLTPQGLRKNRIFHGPPSAALVGDRYREAVKCLSAIVRTIRSCNLRLCAVTHLGFKLGAQHETAPWIPPKFQNWTARSGSMALVALSNGLLRPSLQGRRAKYLPLPTGRWRTASRGRPVQARRRL